MPRIRKKTSKRGSTAQRSKIKQKAAESRKKNKKEAKKNPQWKSKHTKDPGIPNNFPFKDQILAEIAETRRQAEEAKQRKKEEKKATKAAVSTFGNEGDSDNSAGSEEVDLAAAGVTEAVGSLRKGKAKAKAKVTPVQMHGEEEEIPLLVNPELPNLRAVLEQADVVVHVLDARDPLPFISSHLVSQGRDSQRTVLVLSKIDTCPSEAVSSWLSHFRARYPTFPFRSSSSHVPQLVEQAMFGNTKGKGKESTSSSDAWGTAAFVAHLTDLAKEKKSGEPLAVAFVGLVNSGKSSLINSLLRRTTLRTYDVTSLSEGRSTTSMAQEQVLEAGEHKIRLIDTPGLAWESATTDVNVPEDFRIRDILLRNRGRIERIKDSTPFLEHIVSRTEPQELMLFYNVPAFVKGDTASFVAALARIKGLIKRSGDVDSAGAARLVLNDWRTGKLPRYSLPPIATTGNAGSGVPADNRLTELYAKDEAVFSLLLPKKELRKGPTGLVRLAASPEEKRVVALELPFLDAASDEASDEEDADMDVRMALPVAGESQDDDEDVESSDKSDDDVEEDEDDEEGTAPAGKRKRSEEGLEGAAQRPAKKVAFAPPPNSKAAERKARKDGPSPVGRLNVKGTQPKQPSLKPGKKSGKTPANARKKVAAVPASGDGQAYDFNQFFR